MSDRQDWERDIVSRVARQVARYRDEQLLSNEDLRDRLERLGWKLSKDGLASLLAGGKKRASISVGDVLLLAAALDVPPISLISDILGDGTRQATPSEDPMLPLAFELWLTGDQQRPSIPGHPRGYLTKSEPRRAWNRVEDAANRLLEVAVFGAAYPRQDPSPAEAAYERVLERRITFAFRSAQDALRLFEEKYPDVQLPALSVNPEFLRTLKLPGEDEPEIPIEVWAELFAGEGWDTRG